MDRRLVVAVLLAVVGLAVTAFFWLLFAITDCSPDCVERGERAVPLAFVGLGLGLVASAFFVRRSTYAAVAFGMIGAGVVGSALIAWIMTSEGSRGQAVWIFIAMLALVAIGAGMMSSRRDLKRS